MSNSYVLLEKIVVGSAGASSVTFSNIPQTGYTDLVVKMSPQANNSASSSYALRITYNGNAANYSDRYLRGSGASVISASNSSGSSTYLGEIPSTFLTNIFGNVEVYIPNYTGSTNKSFSSDGVSEANATTAWATLTAGLWANTSAITSVTISSTVNLAPNSTFYLYGVAKLGTTPTIAPKATGGDVVMTDGTYWYHAFRASGTFAPTQSLTADILVVAGGGGSRNYQGGGGGAGGLLDFTSQSLTAINHTVTVGGGGALNANGTDSQFAALTLVKGGGCSGGVQTGPTNFPDGSNGGSGGGGAGGVAVTQNGGTATSGQGSNGGAGNNSSPNFGGGGGGGKGATGAAGTSSAGGAGGIGSSSFSSWGSATGTGQNSGGTYYFAGGGTAGSFAGSWSTAGGLGGGGAGGTSAAAGTANTGGGGGCGIGSSGVLGKAGGSGIVIVRYLVA
jgi:hypothetical protein